MDLLEKRVNEQNQLRHPWEEARYTFVLEKVSRLLDMKSEVCVFDIGCGDAYFIAKLCRQFPHFKGVGVDVNFTDEDLISIPETYGLSNLKIFRTIEEAKISGVAPHLILLMDVIEHIEDDRTFLSDLVVPALRPEGTIVLITVPAFQRLFSQHDVFLKHYRRYDNARLRTTVESVGLSVLEIGYFFSMLLPLRVLEKLRDKLFVKKQAEGLANWTKGPLLTRAIYRMMVWDTKVSNILRRVGISLPGLSNFVMCTK